MKDSSRAELMRKIQETSFACVDMNLYLDNHPDDKNAINTYNSLCRYAYENKYGPLTNFGYAPSRCPWQWADQPWPWDREFNY